ncbi:hypothetical protein MRX96_042242 [Rhipicephalus microplus]
MQQVAGEEPSKEMSCRLSPTAVQHPGSRQGQPGRPRPPGSAGPPRPTSRNGKPRRSAAAAGAPPKGQAQPGTSPSRGGRVPGRERLSTVGQRIKVGQRN